MNLYNEVTVDYIDGEYIMREEFEEDDYTQFVSDRVMDILSSNNGEQIESILKQLYRDKVESLLS